MKLYQLWYLPNQWWSTAITVGAAILAVTLVDWAPVSDSLWWEAALTGVLTVAVFVATVTGSNLVVRLRADRWPADA